MAVDGDGNVVITGYSDPGWGPTNAYTCLLYTSDAADDLPCVDLGGRRIIKKKTPVQLKLR